MKTSGWRGEPSSDVGDGDGGHLGGRDGGGWRRRSVLVVVGRKVVAGATASADSDMSKCCPFMLQQENEWVVEEAISDVND